MRGGTALAHRCAPQAALLLAAVLLAAYLPTTCAQTAPETGTRNGTAVNSGIPTLYECRFVVQRLLGLFLFELLCEFGMVVLRFLYATEVIETELISVTIIRGVYAFLIVPFNFSALWWGRHGPKGTCLSFHDEVRLGFAILLFYTMFSFLHVVLLLFHIKHEEGSEYGDDYSDYDDRRNRGRGGRSKSGSESDLSDDDSGRKFSIAKLFSRR